MKLLDKRTVVHRDIKLVALCTLCFFLGGVAVRVGNHLEIKANEPTWVEQQATLHLDPFKGSCLGEGCEIKKGDAGLDIAPEVTRAIEIKEFQLSDRALDHVAKRPETARKISEKFGEYGQYAIELYSRESGLNHLAVNPSSKAGGIVQALPFSKTGCSLEDLDCQLEWGKKYIEQRYGNAQKALQFHDLRNWY